MAAETTRRASLNSHFSRARISSRPDLIGSKIDRLCGRINDFASTGRSLPLGDTISAFQRDVSNYFVLGKDFGDLEKDDFGSFMTAFARGIGPMWHRSKHMPWYGRFMHSIFKDFLIKNADPITAAYMRYARASPADYI
ncbi:hypothetical protein JX265_011713 [Neoarthrinium moseri]|uniref:Uncharacterized protein n=1 Tax=Neoarthrinium moseri TaxID=1658444 RepID=A0A9Q0AHA2_9PEZI|nr:hypothetical protein JX265_011713 [Neoarthrinium moseri]